jgi:outer membrane protein assembly factor BamB
MTVSRRTFLTSLAAIPAVAGLAAGARVLSDDDSSPPRVLAGGPAPTGAWTFRGDSARTGQMPGPGWDASPVTLWATDLGEPSSSPPAVVDGVVYAGFGSFEASGVVALDAGSGAERWRFPALGAVTTAPAVVGGTVFAGSAEGHVYALDAGTGILRWRFEAEGLISGSPAVAGGLGYVADDAAKVYALDAATGDQVWRFDRKTGPTVAPAVSGDLVFVGGGDLETDDPALFALDAASGKKRWSKKLGSWVVASPTIVDGTVYVASSVYLGMNGPAVVAGFDAASGDDRWRMEQEDSVGAPVLVHGDTIYITTELNALLAIDRISQTQRWRYADMADGDFTPDPFSPAVAGGLLYVPTIRATPGVWSQGLAALDPATGTPRWTWAGPDPEADYTTPAILDGVAYTASTDGHVYAVAAPPEDTATPIPG